ncbi:MAG: hypothetical protein JXR94_20800, partial [Candidatus Hydrogenedentes bacterium]|nr:hypothetical protein [Candidatus Hydrogenedentota bacterium]
MIWIGLFATGLLTAAASGPAADGPAAVSWRAGADGAREEGIRALDGADGFTRPARQRGAWCLANKPDTDPASVYAYFDVLDGRAFEGAGPVYAVVEYFDAMAGGVIQLQYDSAGGDG